MAQYKVIQDIEAEDKLLGPLSLRQFIYAAITIALGFIAFRLFMTPVWFIGIAFVVPALFFGLLAAPIGGQQSSEIWLLAKIRFFLKPRKRIWDQTGILDLVTITVPKKLEARLTNGYSQDEVKSRLKTLATTLDTRGWAIKNATQNMYTATDNGTDRLLNISAEAAPTVYVDPAADMLDPETSPRAQAMDQMINKSTQQHRQQVINNMRTPSESISPFAPPPLSMPQPQVSTTISSADEKALLNRLHSEQSKPDAATSHMKTLQPHLASVQNSTQKQGGKQVTPQQDPAILNLVENSEDLSVQTIARQANRIKDQGSDEVVISLH